MQASSPSIRLRRKLCSLSPPSVLTVHLVGGPPLPKLAKHRARSYLGAAKSASLAGDADRHKAHVAKLAEVCGIAAATTSVQDRNDMQLRTLPCAWLAR